MIEDGFYWVKTADSDEWTIGELEGGEWFFAGSTDIYSGDYIREVGPQIKPPV